VRKTRTTKLHHAMKKTTIKTTKKMKDSDTGVTPVHRRRRSSGNGSESGRSQKSGASGGRGSGSFSSRGRDNKAKQAKALRYVKHENHCTKSGALMIRAFRGYRVQSNVGVC